MLLSFVMPEVLLAVALLFVVTTLPLPVGLGTTAQVIGLVTFQVAYPAVLVRARLATIGQQYEEAAMDLGASPLGALRRVIAADADAGDLRQHGAGLRRRHRRLRAGALSVRRASTEPVSVKIYNTARAAPTPALNALATLLLLAALAAVVIGFLVFRRMTRSRHHRRPRIGAFAGEA